MSKKRQQGGENSMKLYVASSWRNPLQPGVVARLRIAGHEVYDFRNPCEGDTGFSWSEIDPDWERWTPEGYLKGVNHELARDGFKKDFDAMKWADACVLVQPCGRSAHLELGWFVGAGKPAFVVLTEGEPELMLRAVLETGGGFALSLEDLCSKLESSGGF